MIDTVTLKFSVEYRFYIETLLTFVNEQSGVISPYKREQVTDVTYSDSDPNTLLLIMEDETEWRVHFGDELEAGNALKLERLDKEEDNA